MAFEIKDGVPNKKDIELVSLAKLYYDAMKKLRKGQFFVVNGKQQEYKYATSSLKTIYYIVRSIMPNPDAFRIANNNNGSWTIYKVAE